MSGIFGGKQKQTSTQTNTLDPQYGGAVYGNLQRAQGIADTPFQPYTGQRVAGMNPFEQDGLNQTRLVAQSNVSGDHLMAALNNFNQLGNFQAPTAQVTNYDAITGNRSDIRDVNGAPVTAEQIRSFYNPYEDDVVGSFYEDNNRQAKLADLQARGRATSAGAWGGSGEGVLRGLTQDSYIRAGASGAANLRNQGFQTALGAAQQDAGRNLQAQLANQGVDYNLLSQNLGYRNNAASQNAQSANQFSLANQAAALQAANTRLGANQAQFGAAQGLRQNAYDDAAALVNAGSYQRGIDQAGLDAAYEQWGLAQQYPFMGQNLINQSLGLVPQTGTTTGTSVTKSNPGLGGVLGSLGTLALGAGALGFSPFSAGGLFSGLSKGAAGSGFPYA